MNAIENITDKQNVAKVREEDVTEESFKKELMENDMD